MSEYISKVTFEGITYNIKDAEARELIENVDGDKTYVHTQRVPSKTWEISHDLNKYPSVSIVDSFGEYSIGDIEYLDLNNLIIRFNDEIFGEAFLN